MSGGSYNYLYNAFECGDLLDKINDVQRMADRLSELDYAVDAAKQTQLFANRLRTLERQIYEIHDQVHRQDSLSDIWKAVEWWDSCDSGEDSVKKAIDEYRVKIKSSEN